MPFRSLSGVATAATLLFTSTTSAQFYGNGGCSSCGTARPVAAASCTPVRPVYSTCYQTVPVTTYRPEKQTVREPFYKTAFEEREYTVYEPVTQKRTIEVPTVSYQTVVENRTVHRDLGRWQTNYSPIAKCSPCQIDSRPGMLGWLNRTGYAFRSSFTPSYRTSRQYVPNMVACNIPTTRQVAIRGTRKVVVNDTKMVARTKTDRVEVKKLAWREREITVNRAVVSYRTVPIGSTLAYGGGYGYPGRSVAFLPLHSDSATTAARPTTDPKFTDPDASREAFREDNLRSTERSFEQEKASAEEDDVYRRSSFETELSPPIDTSPLQKSPHVFPHEDTKPDDTIFDDFNSDTRGERRRVTPAAHRRTVVSTGGWKTSRNAETTTTASSRRSDSPEVSMTNK